MPSRKRKVRPLTASQVLMNPTAKPTPWWEVFSISTANPTLLRESNGENIHGWPVRASEYLTLSRAQLHKLVEQERQKPTLNKLHARLRARQRVAIWETEDLDTCWRLLNEAELEWLRPQGPAYQRLTEALEAQSKKGGHNSAEKRATKSEVWQRQANTQMKKSKKHQSAHAMAKWVWSELMSNETWENDFPGEDAVRAYINGVRRTEKNANRTNLK